MSRLNFDFDNRLGPLSQQERDDHQKANSELPYYRAWRSRRQRVRKDLLNVALFAFGFGSGYLLLQISASFLLLYFATGLHYPMRW